MKVSTILEKLNGAKVTEIEDRVTVVCNKLTLEFRKTDQNVATRFAIYNGKSWRYFSSFYEILPSLLNDLHGLVIKDKLKIVVLFKKKYYIDIFVGQARKHHIILNELQQELIEWAKKVVNGDCPVGVFHDWLMDNNKDYASLIYKLI